MLCDYHIHSVYSDDADHSMTEMAQAALELNVEEICFTDHVDLDDINGVYNPDAWREAEYRAGFAIAEAVTGEQLSLRLGVELGEATHYPEKAAAIAAAIPDFIIGSVHNLAGMGDFYLGRKGGEEPEMYADRARCHELLERYLGELEDTVALGLFDVLGHIGYPLRYMRTVYPDMSLEPHRERLAELLRRVIAAGKGIEVNTSGLRQSLGETMPAGWILRLYRDLGGEVLTIGSDAHNVFHVGAGVEKAKKMLQGLGFTQYCVYNKRKMRFLPLD